MAAPPLAAILLILSGATALQLPLAHAPSGMLARGHYKVKSKFIDDDKAGIFEFLEIFEKNRFFKPEIF